MGRKTKNRYFNDEKVERQSQKIRRKEREIKRQRLKKHFFVLFRMVRVVPFFSFNYQQINHAEKERIKAGHLRNVNKH
jgi:hypothetical protein